MRIKSFLIVLMFFFIACNDFYYIDKENQEYSNIVLSKDISLKVGHFGVNIDSAKINGIDDWLTTDQVVLSLRCEKYYDVVIYNAFVEICNKNSCNQPFRVDISTESLLVESFKTYKLDEIQGKNILTKVETRLYFLFKKRLKYEKELVEHVYLKFSYHDKVYVVDQYYDIHKYKY